jgi:hypothetical protein
VQSQIVIARSFGLGTAEKLRTAANLSVEVGKMLVASMKKPCSQSSFDLKIATSEPGAVRHS